MLRLRKKIGRKLEGQMMNFFFLAKQLALMPHVSTTKKENMRGNFSKNKTKARAK